MSRIDIYDYLTKEQLNEIKKRILFGCNSFKNETNNLYKPYMQMRKQILTSHILTQFSPEVECIDGFDCQDVNYGLNKKMVQPELTSKNCIVQIYRNGNLNNCLIKGRCKKYNESTNNKPYFIIIAFDINKQHELKKIEAVFKNDKCKTIYIDSIYRRPNIQLQVVNYLKEANK